MSWRRSTWPAFVIVSLSMIALHAYLARFAHPMADDFAYARRDVSLGAWHAAAWEYAHWNGRYTSNFLVLFGPLRRGLEAIELYRMVPVALLILTLGSCFIFLRTIGRPGLTRAHAAIVAVVWTVLYAHIMPDMPEGYYWYTGSVTYQLPSILTLIAAALIVRAARDRSPWIIAAAGLLVFLIVGCNEVIMALMVCAGAFSFLLRVPAGNRWSVRIPVLCAIAIGASLMFLAPGNAVRSAHFPDRHHLLVSLRMSAVQTARFALEWITCPAVLLLSVVWWMSHRSLTARHPLLASGFGLAPRTSLLLLFGVIFICVFPAYWSTGILGQHRTANVACFFFLPLWFLNLTVFATRHAGTILQVHERDKPRVTAALVLLITLDLCFTGNSGKALSDLLTGRAERADAQLHARYTLLREAASGPDKTASIPLIQDPPKSLYVLDLRDPGFLVNEDYAAWFGLKEVRIAPAQSVEAKATN